MSGCRRNRIPLGRQRMALSDQLTDLARRTKQLDDSAAAAREKDRTKLEEDASDADELQRILR